MTPLPNNLTELLGQLNEVAPWRVYVMVHRRDYWFIADVAGQAHPLAPVSDLKGATAQLEGLCVTIATNS